jgi:serine/threonine protein kinase
MALTADQRNFINLHIATLRDQQPLNKRGEKRLRSQFADWARRDAKVTAELDKLKGSDQYDDLVQMQALATDAKDQNRYETAYKQLETVKTLARNAAKGYVSGLTYETLHQRIQELRDDIDPVAASIDTIFRALDRLTDDLAAALALASPKAELQRDNTREHRNDLLEAALATREDLLLRLTGIEDDAKGVVGEVDAVDLSKRKETLAAQIKVAQSYGSKKQQKWLGGLVHLLDDSATELLRHDETLFTDDAVKDRFAREIAAARDAVKQRFTAWGQEFKTSEPEPTPTGGWVQARTGKAPRNADQGTYEQAEIAYDNAMVEAIARLKAEQERDADALKPESERRKDPGYLAPPIPQAKELRTYKIGDALGEEMIEKLRGLAPPNPDSDEPPPQMPSNEDIEEAAQNAADHVADTLRESDPDSDEVFDLYLKDERTFIGDIGQALGWDKNQLTWTAEQSDAVTAIARRMAKARQDNVANKQLDATSLQFGNKTYGNKQVLGAGTFGEVSRYTCDDDDSAIVVKRGLGGDATANIGTEMRSHRMAMGGEGGEGHPNLTKLLGGAVGSDGTPLMVTEECSGDVTAFAKQLNALSDSGAIPKEVRDRLLRKVMEDVVKGMRWLHDQGLTHNDIKSANFLIDGDGTVKVADLGSTRTVDAQGKTQKLESEASIPYTMMTVAPEETESAKSDSFSIGAMMDMLADPKAGKGRAYVLRGNRQTTTDDPDGGKVVRNTTAFERLRNAMLDDDPDKRPSMETVLLSSYLDQPEDDSPEAREGQDFDHDGDVVALKRAIGGLAKAEKQIASLTKEIRFTLDAMQRLTDPDKTDELAKATEKHDALQEKLAVATAERDRLSTEIANLCSAGQTTQRVDDAAIRPPLRNRQPIPDNAPEARTV